MNFHQVATESINNLTKHTQHVYFERPYKENYLFDQGEMKLDIRFCVNIMRFIILD